MRSASLLLLSALMAAASDPALEGAEQVAEAIAVKVAAGKVINIKHDHTTREGNGDNLPYMGMDYLGMGYDLIKGNPHGDPDTMVRAAARMVVGSLAFQLFRCIDLLLLYSHRLRSRHARLYSDGPGLPHTCCRADVGPKRRLA
jgi:hypothetical protein